MIFKPMFDDENETNKVNKVNEPNENIEYIVFEDVKQKKDETKLPKECKDAGFKIIPFPTNKNQIKQRSAMERDIIPRHSSSVIFNGKSGSGKSQLLVNLMARPEFYGPIQDKHYFGKATSLNKTI